MCGILICRDCDSSHFDFNMMYSLIVLTRQLYQFAAVQRGLATILLFAFVHTAGSVALLAQVDRTAITGTVTDQLGNRVPQCKVRATGSQRETLTTSQRDYELPGLPPGIYPVQFLRTVSSLSVYRLRLRADAFNIFYRAQFDAPSANLSQVNFGVNYNHHQ